MSSYPIPITLTTKAFFTISSKHIIYTLTHITLSSYIETRKVDEYSLCVSGAANLQPSKLSKEVFRNISQNICLNITAECTLHNVCHL